MDDKPFDRPVLVKTSEETVKVGSTIAARDMLSSVDWPERGYRHQNAVDACLKVLDGHRSISDARDAFVEAAREPGILDTAHRNAGKQSKF